MTILSYVLSFLSHVNIYLYILSISVCMSRSVSAYTHVYTVMYGVFPGDSVIKNLSASAEDVGDGSLIPGSGRSPGVGNGNPLQYSCLESHTWQATVLGVKKESNMT